MKKIIRREMGSEGKRIKREWRIRREECED